MMTRSSSRRIWLAVIAGLLLGAFLVFRQGQTYQDDISRKESQVSQLRKDLVAGNQFSALLTELDNITIDENRATTLDILRHLDLEESTMFYSTKSKTSRPIGGTTLYTRRFTLEGEMSYQEALAQVDWLHNTNKVVLNKVTMKPGAGFGNTVKLTIEGTLYGLEKS